MGGHCPVRAERCPGGGEWLQPWRGRYKCRSYSYHWEPIRLGVAYTEAMRAGKSDTPREVEHLVVEGYRRMTPREKLERVSQLNRSIRALALAGIRQRYGPDLSEREVRLRLAALSIDRETMIQAFDWDPDEHGL